MAKYQGFTNFSTWLVCLYIENNRESYDLKKIYSTLNPWTQDSAKLFVDLVMKRNIFEIDSGAEYSEINWAEVAHEMNQE